MILLTIVVGLPGLFIIKSFKELNYYHELT